LHQKAFGGRAPPDRLVAILGPTSKGRGGRGGRGGREGGEKGKGKGKGREREGKRKGKGREGKGEPPFLFKFTPLPAGFSLNPVSDKSLDPDDHPVRICFPQLYSISFP